MTRLTAIITAAALAATTVAAPAAAQSDEELLGKILTGAAILGIGAAIIDKRKDRKEEEARRKARARSEVSRSSAWGEQGWLGQDRPVIDGEVVYSKKPGKGKGKPAKRKPLPASCRVTVSTPYGDKQGYASRCLDRSYREAAALPRQCEVLVRTSGGLRAVYGEGCLDRNGWKTPHKR